MFFPISGWFTAFVLTLAIEIPIAAFLLRRAEPHRLRLVVLIVFANLATHPAVWYVFTQPFLVGTLEYTLAAEAWAISAEAVFYWAAIRGLPGAPGDRRRGGCQRGLVPRRADRRRVLAGVVQMTARGFTRNPGCARAVCM